MSRIVGGRWAGRRLVAPAGAGTRPTAEKVRAALANALAAVGAIEGSRVLDLYAGTGAVGLELLSSGAASLTAVEQNRSALTSLVTNVEALDARALVRVVPAEVQRFATALVTGHVETVPPVTGHADTRFDLVVADPPYDLPAPALELLVSTLVGSGRLSAGADLIIERSVRSAPLRWPLPLMATRTKRYGDTVLHFGRAP